MVRIRFRRAGGKGQPTHRIVAADKESPRDGRFLEILGDYNPRTEPATIRIKEERVYHWLSVGAQPSKSVLQVFQTIGLMDRYQRYQDGEDLETLIAEGKQVEQDRQVDPRTRRDDLAKVSKPKKAEEAVEEAPEAEAEAPEAEAPESEAEAPEAEAEVEAPEAEAEAPEAEAEAEAPEAEAEEPEPEPEVEEKAEAQEDIKITDAAKKLADDEGIDISTVEGTGKDGGILKSDIEKLIED